MPALRFTRAGVRRGVFFVHLWLGLILGLYFSIAGITGSILVFREDLETRVMMPERTYVQPPAPGAQPLPLSQILSSLRTQFPQARVADFSLINPPQHPGGAYFLRLTVDKKPRATTVNPYTGQVIQQFDYQQTWLNWVDKLHVELLLNAPGKLANGYGALLLSLLLLSGVWVWWPAIWKQVALRVTVKRGAGYPRLIADLHNVFGFYTVGVLLVSALTGSIIVFVKPVQRWVYSTFGPARVARAPVVQVPPGAARLPLEDLVRTAEGIAPRSHWVFILAPTRPNQPLYLYKRSETGILPDTRIYLDPYTGKVLQVGTDAGDPLARQIMRSTSGLHFGRWGAGISKVLYSLTGLAPLGLFVTGVLKYLRRRKAKVAKRQERPSGKPAEQGAEAGSPLPATV